MAVQYARAAGFKTIAVSHSPDKHKMIRELGVDEIVRDGKSLAAAGGADVILSTSNSTNAMNDSIARPATGRPAGDHGRRRGAALDFIDGLDRFKSSAASKTGPTTSTKRWITRSKEK